MNAGGGLGRSPAKLGEGWRKVTPGDLFAGDPEVRRGWSERNGRPRRGTTLASKACYGEVLASRSRVHRLTYLLTLTAAFCFILTARGCSRGARRARRSGLVWTCAG